MMMGEARHPVWALGVIEGPNVDLLGSACSPSDRQRMLQCVRSADSSWRQPMYGDFQCKKASTETWHKDSSLSV
jgi:hypothetical protein